MRILKLAPLAALTLLAACASKPKPGPETPLGEAPAASAPDLAGGSDRVDTGHLPGSLAAQFAAAADERVYFALDSHALDASARAVLAAQADWLRDHPQVRVRVAGNADERSTREYNLALGARRADAVRAFLVAQGIEPGRLDAISYGKERPIDPGADEAAWARNRNAQTVVLEFGVRR